MARTFRSDHDDIYIRRRLDEIEVYRKTMAEEDSLTRSKVRKHIVFKNLSLPHVGHTNHDNIRFGGSFTCVIDFKTILFGDGTGLTTEQSDNDITSAITETLSMSMAL